ncbi:MAG TPA: hypothetical protein VH417_07950 [Vicinamibacterales bacterium]|jgi:hypothetical protein
MAKARARSQPRAIVVRKKVAVNRRRRIVAVVIVLLSASSLACSGDSSNSTLPTTPTTAVSDTLVGTVPAPVNGALQSAVNTFNSQSGTVGVTLTSAVESMPDGSKLANVVMGIGIGTPSGSSCTLMTNAFTTAQPSSAVALSGTVTAGTYCVQVSDVTNQLGPVSYAIVVSHP